MITKELLVANGFRALYHGAQYDEQSPKSDRPSYVDWYCMEDYVKVTIFGNNIRVEIFRNVSIEEMNKALELCGLEKRIK